ncbi:MAG: pentapeptide repeat-containing protein [Dolichospermum sp.]
MVKTPFEDPDVYGSNNLYKVLGNFAGIASDEIVALLSTRPNALGEFLSELQSVKNLPDLSFYESLAYYILSNPVTRRTYDKSLNVYKNVKPIDREMIVCRTDGSSTFTTLGEHLRRGGKELKNANLSGIDLSNTSFWGADLSGANLSQCNLSECNFIGANLEGTSLENSIAIKADFSLCLMKNTNFKQVVCWNGKFLGSRLESANGIQGSFLRSVFYSLAKYQLSPENNQQKTEIIGCNFQEADFYSCLFGSPKRRTYKLVKTTKTFLGNLTESSNHEDRFDDFGAYLVNVDFTRANLGYASFSSLDRSQFSYSSYAFFINEQIKDEEFFFSGTAKLNRVKFDQANLEGVDFSDVDLSGCSLIESNILNTNFDRIQYNKKTLFPLGFVVPSTARKKWSLF